MSATNKTNSSDLANLHISSIGLIQEQFWGNILWAVFSLVGLCMSTIQLSVLFLWKPLRQKSQILVINVCVGDALKSITHAIIAIERLVLAAYFKDEVSTQEVCMYWLMGEVFTIIHSILSVLALSVERLVAVGFPVWYRVHRLALGKWLVLVCLLFSSVATGCCFIDARNDLYQIGCSVMGSVTKPFYLFMLYYQYVCIGCILIVNLATCLRLHQRWRNAVKKNADIKRFKKEVEWNAIKSVIGVVIICMISFVSATALMTAIEKMPISGRAYFGPYVGAFHVVRGVFDFGVYLFCVKEYRKALAQVYRFGHCHSNSVMPINS